MEDQIEQEISIDAGHERVWELVTRPGWWVPSDVDENIPAAERVPGRRTVRDTEKYGRYTIELVKIDPRSYVSFRWVSEFPDEEPKPEMNTLVEFFVKPAGAATKVTVVESGFASLDLTEIERKTRYDGNVDGWTRVLSDLKQESEGGEPAA